MDATAAYNFIPLPDKILPADLDAYRKAPSNQVLRCAECNRILVRTPESGL